MLSSPSWSLVIESLGEGTFVADARGRLVEACATTARILGYPSREALLADAGVLQPFVDWPAVRAGGGPVRLRTLLVVADRSVQIELAVAAHDADHFVGALRQPLAPDQASSDILERNRELEAVRRLANETLLAQTRAQLQRNLLSICLEAVGGEGGTLYLYEPALKRLRVCAYEGMAPAFLQAVETIKLGQGFTGKVAVTRIPMLVDELSTDPRTEFPAVRELGVNNFASFPLVAREKLLGVLNLFTFGAHRFSASDVAVLAALAAQVSLALDHVSGTEELVQRNDELERFNRLAVDRELRMIELKKRIRELEAQLRLRKSMPP